MKKTWSMLAVLALLFAFTVSPQAAEGKKVTLQGTICCAKCELKLQDKCATVIKVKQDGKDVIYYFDEKSNKEHHKKICTEAKEGEVSGTCVKKDDKLILTVEKLKFND